MQGAGHEIFSCFRNRTRAVDNVVAQVSNRFQPALHRTGRTLSMALETELAHRRWLAQHGLTLQWIGLFRLRLARLSVFAFQICLRLSNANCASHRAAQRLIGAGSARRQWRSPWPVGGWPGSPR